MARFRGPVFIAFLTIGVATLTAGSGEFQGGARSLPTIVVSNGDAVIADAIVSLTLPPTLVGESFIVRDGQDGDAVVTQLLRDRTLVFAVRDMAPREVRRLRLEPTLDRRVVGPVVAREHFDGVELSIDRQPVAGYRTQPSLSLTDTPPPGAERGVGRGGYLHPLRTPGGAIVTDDDVPERPEQRGLWSAWGATRVNGRMPDFWHTATGAVEFEGVLRTWSGPVVAGFQARHRAVDRTVRPPLTAETETWQVTLPALGRDGPAAARGGPRYRASILTIAHEDVLAQPIVVAAAAYGGLGLRGPRAPGTAAPGWRSSPRRGGRGAPPRGRGRAGSRWSASSAAPTPASPSSIIPTTCGIRRRSTSTPASRS